MAKPSRVWGQDDFKTKIHGVTHLDTHSGLNRQEIIRRFVKPGTRLWLRSEPDNPVDPNTVAIWMDREGSLGRVKSYKLGYLSRERAQDMARNLEEGHSTAAWVLAVTGGREGKETLGVNIRVRVFADEEQPRRRKWGRRKVVVAVVLVLLVVCLCLAILTAEGALASAVMGTGL